MINKIEQLKKLVGQKYEMTFVDGSYKGCFMPVYELYPDFPKYILPIENLKDCYDFAISRLSLQAFEVDNKDVRLGDILVTKLYKQIHVAVYIGSDCIIQVFEGSNLQIDRAGMFKNTKWYRMNAYA